ncbi:MAG TPA: hypothetical protein PLJ47_12570 [Candidatus Hydrogenedentes bacterium]|nr:hypothetical protein [Candidatus Hydrogenedentota bacterium]HRK35422.1 hypothetical protein [Candidatus Hydrogenedentota bacterium]
MSTNQQQYKPADYAGCFGCAITVVFLLSSIGTMSAFLHRMFEYNPTVSPEFEAALSLIFLVIGLGICIASCVPFLVPSDKLRSEKYKNAISDTFEFAILAQFIPPVISVINGLTTGDPMTSIILGLVSIFALVFQSSRLDSLRSIKPE